MRKNKFQIRYYRRIKRLSPFTIFFFRCHQESDFPFSCFQRLFLYISVLNSKVPKLPHQFLYQKINFNVVFIISRIRDCSQIRGRSFFFSIKGFFAPSSPFVSFSDRILEKKKNVSYFRYKNLHNSIFQIDSTFVYKKVNVRNFKHSAHLPTFFVNDPQY